MLRTEQIELNNSSSFSSAEPIYDTVNNQIPELLCQFQKAAKLVDMNFPHNLTFYCDPENVTYLEKLMGEILIIANHGKNRDDLENLVLKFYFSLTHSIPRLSRCGRIRLLLREIFRCC